MRCDIQQLTGKGTVNDSSITTLATERLTRSPHRHHAEFILTSQKPHAQRGSNMLLRDPCAQRQQAVTACLHPRFAAISEKLLTDDIMARIIANGQCVRHRVLIPCVPNADTTSMIMQCVAPQLASNAGRVLVSAISELFVVRVAESGMTVRSWQSII